APCRSAHGAGVDLQPEPARSSPSSHLPQRGLAAVAAVHAPQPAPLPAARALAQRGGGPALAGGVGGALELAQGKVSHTCLPNTRSYTATGCDRSGLACAVAPPRRAGPCSARPTARRGGEAPRHTGRPRRGGRPAPRPEPRPPP